jgi:hypothetical protein
MTDFSVKGKEKEVIKEAETSEPELTEAEKKKRSFERSLAGPSVGKAGLIRDQTGTFGSYRGVLRCRDQSDHRRSLKGGSMSELN